MLTQQEKDELLAEFNKSSKSDVDQINQLIQEKLGKIDKAQERLDEIETKMNRPPIEIPKDDSPLKTKAGQFHYEVKSAYDKAFFDTYLRKGQKFLAPEESKALIIGSDPSAGYLTSVEYGREIIKAITEFSPIRAEATVRSTMGTEITFPKRSALPDTHWVGEISERVEDASFEYKMEKLTPHEVISFKKLSLQQIEDAAFNLASELGEAFGEAFGLKEGTAFVTGSGVTQPEGILTHAGVGETETAAAGVIDADDIMGFPYLIAKGYRKNAKWYMNDVTLAIVRKFKSATEELYIFTDPIAGDPAKLAGYPIVSCPDMPDIAEEAYPIVFGDMRKAYMIVDRIAFAIQELRERYAEYGMVGFIARKRVDGQVVLPAAIRKLKIKKT
ncbi:hypothetical protein ES703_21640 [subsurface metagenome]